MPAFTLNNPPRRLSESCYLLHKCEVNQSAVSLFPPSMFSNPPNGSKNSPSPIQETQNIKLITVFNVFWLEHISRGVKCHSNAVFRRPIGSHAGALAGAVIAEFSPVLASGPITQLTCLLTRSPYLCRAAFSVPGCLYSRGLFAKSKC